MKKPTKLILLILSYSILIPIIISMNLVKGKFELSHNLIFISLLLSLIINAILFNNMKEGKSNEKPSGKIQKN